MRVAVLASGGGSNLQALLDAVEDGSLPATIGLVVSDRPGIGALDRAQRHGVPTTVIAPADYDRPEAFGGALLEVLRSNEIHLVALAGYLRHIPSQVVAAYRHRMLNVHPSLLPAFGGKGLYGRRVHEAVLDYGVRWTGATIHIVDEEYDTGPIVLQEPVRVEQDDTPETLAARVLSIEHRLYPRAVRLFAEDRVSVVGRKVRIGETSDED